MYHSPNSVWTKRLSLLHSYLMRSDFVSFFIAHGWQDLGQRNLTEFATEAKRLITQGNLVLKTGAQFLPGKARTYIIWMQAPRHDGHGQGWDWQGFSDSCSSISNSATRVYIYIYAAQRLLSLMVWSFPKASNSFSVQFLDSFNSDKRGANQPWTAVEGAVVGTEPARSGQIRDTVRPLMYVP